MPYAGKVSIDGINFDGQLKFMFAIYTASNDMVWDSGSDPIEVPVSNGRYLVLLGGQGMRPLPASLFHENDELYVGVYADLPNDDVGQVKLGELQRITAQPYALVAEMAKMADVANSAKVADSVKAGAVTPADDQSSSDDPDGTKHHHHRPVERANLKIFKARNYPHPTGTRFDLWRADRHPAIPSRREVSVLSMVQEWSAHRRGDG